MSARFRASDGSRGLWDFWKGGSWGIRRIV